MTALTTLEIARHILTGVSGLSVYLTGPTSGLYDHAAFYDAARILRDAGATVAMPHDPTPGVSLRVRLRTNVAALLDSDVLVLLEGWERSASCTIDIATAEGARIRVMPFSEIVI